MNDASFASLAALYASIGRDLAPHRETDNALTALTALAVQIVPGAEYAGISRGRAGAIKTVAATDDLVLRVDRIQYDLDTGPCVDAVLEGTTFAPQDLRTDRRWPEFGRLAAQQTGVLSMLSLRLYLEEDRDGMIAGLNLYATKPAAFDEAAQTVALLLATHGALAIAAAAAREKVSNLQRALQTSREIGVAMGVLMARHQITREQAFDLLRIASQHSHRKLADIAIEVGDTGSLLLPSEPAEPVAGAATAAASPGDPYSA